MRHWHAAGVRPFPSLRPRSRACPPCRSRLFGCLVANSFRHTQLLLDGDGHGRGNGNDKPASVESSADSSPAGDAASSDNAQSAGDAASSDNVQSAGTPSSGKVKGDKKKTAKFRPINPDKHSVKHGQASSEAGSPKKQDALSATAKEPKPHAPSKKDSSQDIPNSSTSLSLEEAMKAPRQTPSRKGSQPPPPKGSQPGRGGRRRPSIVRRIVGNAEQQQQPSRAWLSAIFMHEQAIKIAAAQKETQIRFIPQAANKQPYVPDGEAISTLRQVMLAPRKSPPPLPPKTKSKRAVGSSLKSSSKDKPREKKSRKKSKSKRNVELDSPGTEVVTKLDTKIETIKASDLQLTPLDIEQPPVPRLSYGLDRVLFNKGVYQLQDPHSKVYNFDPYLQKIMPVTEFDYNALKVYKTSSQDTILSDIANRHGKKYVGSTSSMTSTLGHFHYLLSNWRKINLAMLSREFPDHLDSFTELNRAPNAIFLRWKNGTYAIDADKQYDGANVLMMLGKSMEKLLTMPKAGFERYRKGNSDTISAEERNEPESYHYSTQGDFLMRSQLDAYDPRLPGTGMFDLKTRAVVSIRMRSEEYEDMSGYEINKHLGQFESYEREYYDMMRSTTLKYSLQARMGRMDGIFVAYHNVKRIFGFQYLSLNEMDNALHGQSDRSLGDKEFSLSIELLNKAFNKATEKFPNQSIRFHFESRPSTGLSFMYIFAEPMAESDIDEIQNSQKEKVAEYERSVLKVAPRSDSTKAAESKTDAASQPDEQREDETRDATIPELVHNESDVCVVETGTIKITDTKGVDPEESATREPSADNENVSAEEDAVRESSITLPAAGDPPADSTFLSLLDPVEKPNKTTEELKPLLAMVLTVRSRVNGELVERPENLGPEDDWDVEYSLAEVSTPARAWSLYEAAKARRKKLYDRLNAVDDDENNTSEWKAPKRNDYYVNLLREMSQRGRELRDQIDLAEVDKVQVIIGQPHERVDQDKKEVVKDKAEEVRIEGAEDYMKWLFGEKRDC